MSERPGQSHFGARHSSMSPVDKERARAQHRVDRSQYALKARRSSWPACLFGRRDRRGPGLSGSGSVTRGGFRRNAEVRLGDVGIVLGLEVSRLLATTPTGIGSSTLWADRHAHRRRGRAVSPGELQRRLCWA